MYILSFQAEPEGRSREICKSSLPKRPRTSARSLHPLKFIPLTNGAMPLVVLFDDGELVKEYDYISIDEDEIASFFDDQR